MGARRGRRDAPEPALTRVTTGVVAVAVGDGLRTLLRGLGVQQVVAGGQSMNPSTAQILEAVDACVADGVIVLPEQQEHRAGGRAGARPHRPPGGGGADRRGGRGAGRAGRLRPGRVRSTPTARRWPKRPARVRAGEVTQAVRDSVAECGPIATGDWIAITRDGIQVAVKSASDAAVALVDVLVDDDAELVTIIVGAEADAADTARISEHVADAHPTSRSRCTTVTSRSTRTSSASSSSGPAVAAGPHAARARVAPRHRAEGGRRQAARRPGRDGHRDGARPAGALPPPLRRPHRAGRDPRARDRPGGDGRRRGASRSTPGAPATASARS